jgi:hypothetical protein
MPVAVFHTVPKLSCTVYWKLSKLVELVAGALTTPAPPLMVVDVP